VSLLAGGDDDARQKTLAVVLAAKAGRYHAMVAAMKRANVEPPIIVEDLVHFGMDEGRKEGLKEGLQEGRKEGRQQLASMLAAILATRGLVPDADHQSRIQAQASLEQLRIWCERALTAASVDDVFTG
jgi:flagellar biosynthesis/type III secretory pathway protein FliH